MQACFKCHHLSLRLAAYWGVGKVMDDISDFM